MQSQQKHLLKPTIAKLLNDQIKKENGASNQYLAMATWCDINGYQGSATLLYSQAEEERAHMLKLVHYLIEYQEQPIIPSHDNIKPHHDSLRNLFEKVLQQEKEVTESIHHIVHHALTNQDYATFNFLQWFVTEQREEENQAQRILDLFELIGQEGIGLYTIDAEIGKLGKKGIAIA